MGPSVNKRLNDLERKVLADRQTPASRHSDTSRLTPQEQQRWLELKKIGFKSQSHEEFSETLRLMLKAGGVGCGLTPGGAPPGPGAA
jgi:hypothetical protein